MLYFFVLMPSFMQAAAPENQILLVALALKLWGFVGIKLNVI